VRPGAPHQEQRAARRRTAAHALLAAALALAAYGGSVRNGFTFDDFQMAFDVPAAWRWPGLAALLGPRYFELVPELSYRPVATLSHYADFIILNRDSAHGRAAVSHLTSVLLHAANAALALLLLRKVGLSPFAALAAAALFAVHPAASEAVCAVAFREDLLVLGFAVAALLARCAAIESAGRGRAGWGLAMCGLASLALLSKESALLLPAAALLTDAVQPCAGPRRPRLLSLGLLVALDLLYLALRFGPMRRPLEAGLPLWSGDRWHAFLGACNILVQYVRLSLVPIGLSLEHLPPTGQTLPALWKLGSVAFVAGAIALAALWWRQERTRSFGVLWFAVWILPVCHLVPIANPMAERFLYAPLLGPMALLAAALDRPAARRRRWAAAAIGGLLVCFGALTLCRVADWHSQRTLHVAALRWTPRSARAMSNLGETYRRLAGPSEQERSAADDLAEQEFLRGAAADPAEHSTRFNLGCLHSRRAERARLSGNDDEVRDEYERALAWLRWSLAVLLRQPHFSWTASRYHDQTGVAYWNLGHHALALTHFRAAVRLDPRNRPAADHARTACDYLKRKGLLPIGTEAPDPDGT